jgi:hypothetical protein
LTEDRIHLRSAETVSEREKVVLEEIGLGEFQSACIEGFEHGVGAQLILNPHGDEDEAFRDDFADEGSDSLAAGIAPESGAELVLEE